MGPVSIAKLVDVIGNAGQVGSAGPSGQRGTTGSAARPSHQGGGAEGDPPVLSARRSGAAATKDGGPSRLASAKAAPQSNPDAAASRKASRRSRLDAAARPVAGAIDAEALAHKASRASAGTAGKVADKAAFAAVLAKAVAPVAAQKAPIGQNAFAKPNAQAGKGPSPTVQHGPKEALRQVPPSATAAKTEKAQPQAKGLPARDPQSGVGEAKAAPRPENRAAAVAADAARPQKAAAGPPRAQPRSQAPAAPTEPKPASLSPTAAVAAAVAQARVAHAGETQRPKPGETAEAGRTAAQAKPISPDAKRALAAFRGTDGARQATAPSSQAAGAKVFTLERSGAGDAATSQVSASGASAGPAAQGPGAAPAGPNQAAAAEPRSAAPPTIGEQIAESIRASDLRDGRQIVVHLHPPELGRVLITLRSQGDQIRGALRVESEETLSRLQREAAGLVQRLQDAGIQMRRLDLALSDSRDGQPNPDGAAADGERHEQAFAAEGDAAAAADPEADAEAEEVPLALVGAGGSINVRI